MRKTTVKVILFPRKVATESFDSIITKTKIMFFCKVEKVVNSFKDHKSTTYFSLNFKDN